MHDSTCCSGVPPLQRADQKAAKAARQAGAGTLGGGGGSGAASAPTAGWGRFKSTGQVELQASQRAVAAQSMASARAGPGFAGASLTVESKDDEEEGHAAPVAGKQEQALHVNPLIMMHLYLICCWNGMMSVIARCPWATPSRVHPLGPGSGSLRASASHCQWQEASSVSPMLGPRSLLYHLQSAFVSGGAACMGGEASGCISKAPQAEEAADRRSQRGFSPSCIPERCGWPRSLVEVTGPR